MSEKTYSGFIIHYKQRHDIRYDFTIAPFEYYVKNEDFRGDTYTSYVATRAHSMKHGYIEFLHRSSIYDSFTEAQEAAIQCMKRERDKAILLIHDIDKSLEFQSFMGAGI